MFSTNSRRPEGGAVHLFMEEKDMIKTIITALVLLVVGFILLVKGADFFVEGSASVAKKLKIPSLVIGMTIVAMGTSLPECSVSIIASLNGSNSLSISNAVGSNIFNLMVVCGICTLFIPLEVAKDTIKRDFPFSIACTLLLLFTGYTSMTLGRTEGIVFLVCFAFFILIMVKSAMKSRKISNEAMQEIDEELEEISEDLSGIKYIRNYVNVYRRTVAVSAGYEADGTAGADRQPDFKGNPGKSWLPDRCRTGLSLPFQSDGNTFRR